MLNFTDINKEAIGQLAPFFAGQSTHLSDYSLGYQFMWHRYLAPAFAVIEDCLIIREHYAGRDWFRYPLSRTGDREAERRAVAEVERYCRDHEVRLRFSGVRADAVPWLTLRYSDVTIKNTRRWRDYLYEAEAFRTYAGGKYAGQRNHVNKFKKMYPDWSFEGYMPAREAELVAFLGEYEATQRAKGDELADEEMNEVYELVPMIVPFGLRCGLLRAGGKIVACAIGERCGDMLVVHVEKALRDYEGVYPMVAQQFALAFAGGAAFLNRMDDAGDLGLRKSKLQYLPCEVVGKYVVTPRRPVDHLSELPELTTQRLMLRPVRDEDAAVYARLAGDGARNRWWGYDWRADVAADFVPTDDWFLSGARELFAKKMEMPLGIYRGDVLIGETTLHRFGYTAEAEIGVRLLPEFEGSGYAAEALAAYMAYAFSKLELERVEAKHFHENARSGRSLQLAGMKKTGEDEMYVYYEKTAKM